FPFVGGIIFSRGAEALRHPKSCHPKSKAGAPRPTSPENDSCKNYRVINARLCLINHNRRPALSMTCNPSPRPRLGRKILRGPESYIYVCTHMQEQSVSRETLCTYNRGWATRLGRINLAQINLGQINNDVKITTKVKGGGQECPPHTTLAHQ